MKNTDWLLIQAVNRSPNIEGNYLDELSTVLCYDRWKQIKFSHRVIVGDFNFKDIDWITETTQNSENHPTTRFLEVVRDNYMFQHVNKPTRYKDGERDSVLDQIFTNEENMIESTKERMIKLAASDATNVHYVKNNVVSCPHTCSKMKQTQLTYMQVCDRCVLVHRVKFLAIGKTCTLCNRKDHFAKMGFFKDSGNNVHTVHQDSDNPDTDSDAAKCFVVDSVKTEVNSKHGKDYEWKPMA
ncbi:MAG: hypothetical protein ABW185_12200 [Sedimenticola sp.]